MERTYTLAEIAMMTGFTDRTLRNYLKQGLLKGEKVNGTWQFSAEAADAFFAQPFVKEGLRIKRSAAVFDFMGEKKKKNAGSMPSPKELFWRARWRSLCPTVPLSIWAERTAFSIFLK